TFGTNDTIHFTIPGSGPFQINVGSDASALNLPLPQLLKPVLLDGTSQPGFLGTPVIVLNGSQAGAGSNGLDIELGTGGFASGVTIEGLVINQFGGNGILIGADNVSSTVDNTITGNFIGTDATGTSALGNGDNGVFINGVNSSFLATAAS